MDKKTRMDQANSVLNNPVMKDAFKTLEEAYTRKMINTEPLEVEERNKWHSCILALNDVKTALTAFIQDGQIEIENERKKEKMKNDGRSTSSGDKR